LKTLVRAALLLFCAAAALRAKAASPAAPGSAPVGPNAVWRPPADFLTAFHRACDELPGTDFGACFVGEMRRTGASEPALAFARLTGDQGYLEAFRDEGVVDVAYAVYPFRANENELVFLVNGEPPLIDVDDLSRLDAKNLAANPVYEELKKTYPNLAFFPGNRGESRQPRAHRLRSGGRRFVVSYELRDACHACRIVGEARIGFDFDARGRFVGTDVVRVRPRDP